MNCNQIRASIENGFSEPLDPHTQRIVDAHVIDCRDCRAFATETKNVISFASRPTVPEQSGEFWDSYYDRLVEKMELPAAAGSVPVSSSPTWSTWLQHLLPQSRPAIQFALIAAVLVIGILIGRVLSNNNGSLPPQQVAGSAEDGEPGVHLTSLDDRTDRFLDRSKVILLGMVNMDLTETGADDVDLSQ
ncbi:MAG: hypothetical protein HKN43_00160, partial [Rhodothermales bacterium]|nr:hypothetical protein [Rhodothermales bacterium]